LTPGLLGEILGVREDVMIRFDDTDGIFKK